jgi:DNA-binding PadR family transcriptional regulator
LSGVRHAYDPTDTIAHIIRSEIIFLEAPMSVRESLLAILAQGPCYGNQLRAEFDRRTGSTWPINVGQIYHTLDRLERDRLVERGESDVPSQVTYRITAAGRAEASAWLSAPVIRPNATRDELTIKLALALTLPGVDVDSLIAAQLSETHRSVERAQRMRDAASEPHGPEELAAALVADALVVAAESEARWLELAGRRLAAARATGAEDRLPLRADAPKRGRPSLSSVPSS